MIESRLTFHQWADLLDKVPLNERDDFIRESLRDKGNLHIFGSYFFPHIIDYRMVAECHMGLIDFLALRKDGACVFPRGYGKSTWEKIDTWHDIVYALEPVILYISNVLKDAQNHFESIKTELENNEELIRIYGYLVPPESKLGRKWTNVHFETTNGINVVAKSSTKGRGVNIKNSRPTKIVIDDGEDDEMVRSAERLQYFKDWIYGVIYPSKDKQRGYIKMIGTVLSTDCVLLDFKDRFGGIFRAAIEDGESIWPQVWSLEELYELRDGYVDDDGVYHKGIGPRVFSKEWLNAPLDDESALFKRAWLDSNTYEDSEIPELHMMHVVMAVDPNAGMKKLADETGICVMGMHMFTKKRYVLESSGFRVSINDQLDEIRRLYKKWSPVMGVEVVLNQRAVYQILLATNEFRLVELSPQSQDKMQRAVRVEPYVQNGVIKFHPAHVTLYEQLIQFPHGSYDDRADAFFYANQMLDQMSSAGTIESSRSATIAGNIRNRKF